MSIIDIIGYRFYNCEVILRCNEKIYVMKALRILSLGLLTMLFNCTIEDMKNVLNALHDSGLIKRLQSGNVLFEPLETSLAISSIIKLASSREPPSVDIELLITEFSWDRQFIVDILKKLKKERFVIEDDETFWFPSLS